MHHTFHCTGNTFPSLLLAWTIHFYACYFLLASIKYKTYTETVEHYQILCIHKVLLFYKKACTTKNVFDTTSNVWAQICLMYKPMPMLVLISKWISKFKFCFMIWSMFFIFRKSLAKNAKKIFISFKNL